MSNHILITRSVLYRYTLLLCRALYQLQLVKVEEVSITTLLTVYCSTMYCSQPMWVMSSCSQAKKYIPKDLSIVSLFGWAIHLDGPCLPEIHASQHYLLIDISVDWYRSQSHFSTHPVPVRGKKDSVGVDRYTLGGFYLAKYEDSPVGAFEEVSSPLKWQGLSLVNRCQDHSRWTCVDS